MADLSSSFNIPPAGRDLRGKARAGLETRIKILIAAEHLFAERGIAGVSLREIANSAKQANTSAIQYHFGNKQNLLVSLFQLREAQLDPVRANLLVRLKSEGRSRDIKALFEALFLPYLKIVDGAGRHSYAGFLSQYLTHTNLASTPRTHENGVLPAQREMRELLMARLDFLPDHVVWPRIVFAGHSFASTLVRWDSGAFDTGGQLSFHELISDATQQCVASLTAPYRYRHPDLFSGEFPLDDAGHLIRRSSSDL